MYKIVFHKKVDSDLSKIDRPDRKKILDSIGKKLSSNPEEFGKPLRAKLGGFFRLRVGDYRVIYRVVKDKIIVFVVNIGVRRDSSVYEEAVKRLDL